MHIKYALDGYRKHFAKQKETTMTEEQIKHMVDRFLGWKLPPTFNPDNGISFDPVMNKGHKFEGRREPVGTNLFNSKEADRMVRHMTQDMPGMKPTTPEPYPYSEECCTQHVASEKDAKICGNCGVRVDSFRLPNAAH